MRATKIQASLRIRAVSSEPSLLAHTSSESKGTFRQKASSLAPLNGWACAVKVCHDRMLKDTNWLEGAHFDLELNSFQDYFPQYQIGQLLGSVAHPNNNIVRAVQMSLSPW